MGTAADYTVTDNGDGSYAVEYGGDIMTISGIEEIQFTDDTLTL